LSSFDGMEEDISDNKVRVNGIFTWKIQGREILFERVKHKMPRSNPVCKLFKRNSI